jgi:lambda repressor-like predicted transcriptional regulator
VNELAQCAEQVAKWTRKRDRIIRQKHEAGMSLRSIAAEAGLSHTRIAKIIKESER